MADEDSSEISWFSLLPEACIAIIISFTSPEDACSAAAVSLGFKSAADSDTVWERFLPPDYREIIAGSGSPVTFPTKKEIYFSLCDAPLLLDGGKLSLRLCRSTRNKCYMLCARQLQIASTDTPRFWTWTSSPDSRFAEVAELQSVCWLEIRAVLQVRILSPNAVYSAYLVFKLAENHYGLDCSSKALLKFVRKDGSEIRAREISSTLFIVSPTWRHVMRRERWGRWPETDPDCRFSCRRTDGWLEIELGQFYNAEGDDICDVHIQLSETEQLNWKKGLIVDGIELRPSESY